MSCSPRCKRRTDRPDLRPYVSRLRWVALLLSLLGFPGPAPAAGTWEGLTVAIDANWPGCGFGGYFPLRINVVNRGQPRTLTFRFASRYGRMPEVTRSVTVQTERVQLSLLIPCASGETYGQVTVAVDGVDVPQLSESVTIAPSRGYNEAGPAVLLIDTRDADWASFQAAVGQVIGAPSGSTALSSFGASYASGVSVAADHRYIDHAGLPGEWQAYTGLDLVIVSEANYRKLRESVRSAIGKWVETGGNLLVYGLTNPASAVQSQELDVLLGLTPADPGAGAWTEHGGGPGRFLQRDRMFGCVVAIPAEAFPEFSDEHWRVLLQTLGQSRWDWFQRHGFDARNASPDFLDFLIPSVKGVPVFAYLVLITLFSILIGPVNYVYLWKQRRLYLLVVTIPVMAVATSLALFGYSAVSHGFHTRARIRSLTLLDQRTNTAVSASRVSLYAGLAPGRGLQFSRDSAVYPVWPIEGGFESGSVDWTEQQNFGGGWFRSRTQFFVTTHRSERGRLEITPEGSQLAVANGLAWDLAAVIVADDQGRLFSGSQVAAGAAARLAPLALDQLATWRSLVGASPLEGPASLPGSQAAREVAYPGMYDADVAMSQASYESNFAEQMIQGLSRLHPDSPDTLPPRCYAAVLASNPGIDSGVPGAREEASLHVLVGHY